MRTLMKPIEVGDHVLRCAHQKIWPPPHLHLIPKIFGLDVEYLRNRVPNEVYLRLKTWQGVCGLTEMNPTKCSTCPHVLRDAEEPGPRLSGIVPPSVRPSHLVRFRAGLK